MTPKEKAIDLVAQFLSQWFGNLVQSNIWVIKNIPVYFPFPQYDTAKKCAIVAVDEIILEVLMNYDTLHSEERKEFYEQVKREIQKL